MTALTWEIIIRFTALLRDIELIKFDILVIQKQGSLHLFEMLVKPVDGSDHQIGTVQMLLNLNLFKKLISGY